MELPFPVVLASGSPRRRELLKTLIPEFEIIVADVDERLKPDETPKNATLRLAKRKAAVVRKMRPDALVIAADTLVALEESEGWQIFGKPADANEAGQMLRRLSGRTHVVTTGVCGVGAQGGFAFAMQTRVTFRPVDDHEIQAYVATGDSLDKAGAYAIQGLASSFVERIEGSRTNVVGLPMSALEKRLRRYAERLGAPSAPDLSIPI